jgi:hypothetical protein
MVYTRAAVKEVSRLMPSVIMVSARRSVNSSLQRPQPKPPLHPRKHLSHKLESYLGLT